MRFFASKGVVAIGVVLAVLFLVWSGLLPLDRPIGWIARKTLVPLYTRLTHVSPIDIAQENEQLRSLLQDFLGATYAEHERDDRLRDDAAVRAWAEERGFASPIIARVITQYMEQGRRIFVLDQGTSAGITEGASVVFRNGLFAGRIIAVRPASSHLELITASGARASIVLDTADRSMGLAEGHGEDELLQIDFVPQGHTVPLNAVALTSGLDARIPRGMLIGVVNEVRATESSPWATLLVTPLVRPYDLRVVGVLTE